MVVVVAGLVLSEALPVKEKKPTSEEEKKAAEAHEGEGSDDWVSRQPPQNVKYKKDS